MESLDPNKLYREFIEEWNKGEGIHANTSGSTGTPKRIVLPMEQVIKSARRTNGYFGITSGSHLHSAMGLQYIGGKMMIARSLVAGCGISFQVPALHPEVPEQRVSLVCLVPSQMTSVLDRIGEFGHIEKFLIGGAAISPELWQRIVSAGIDAYESYAMTETASNVAIRKIEGDAVKRVPFLPLPDVEISLDPDGAIIVKDGDITVRTNDIGRMDPNGGFHVLGRKDNMIVTGGRKILPQTIEDSVLKFVDFKGHEYFVDSLPHPVWTNEAVLVVKSPDDDNTALIENIRSAILSPSEEEWPRWQRPKKIIMTKKFPMTDNGKLKRNDTEFLKSEEAFEI